MSFLTVRPEDRLTLGFFERLVTPDDEALVDGCRELVLGSGGKALEHLRRAVHVADGWVPWSRPWSTASPCRS